jgi:hypothetical protein
MRAPAGNSAPEVLLQKIHTWATSSAAVAFYSWRQTSPIQTAMGLQTNSLVSRVFAEEESAWNSEYPSARTRTLLTFSCPGALPSVNQDHARRRRTQRCAADFPRPLGVTLLATVLLALVQSNGGQLQTAPACGQTDQVLLLGRVCTDDTQNKPCRNQSVHKPIANAAKPIISGENGIAPPGREEHYSEVYLHSPSWPRAPGQRLSRFLIRIGGRHGLLAWAALPFGL